MEQFSVEIVKEDQREPPGHRLYNWRLIVAVSMASMYALSMGGLAGYPSPALPNLNAHPNPFHVTDDQQSWVGSLLCLGAAAGGLASGVVCDLLGRKLTMMTSSLFIVVGMTIVAAATDAHFLYAGITVAAFFAQVSLTAALLYVSEVTPAEIRGTCMSILETSYSVGMVVAYAMGVPLSWTWLAVFVASLAATPILVLPFLPESPRWFLLKRNREAAIHGVKWFREGVCDMDEVTAIERDLRQSENCGDRKCDHAAWTCLVTDRKNVLSLFVCAMLFIFQGFSGNIALQMFMVTIFQYAGAAQINSNVQSVVSGLCLVAGSVLCMVLVDRIGRKKLLIASCLVVCISKASAAAFFQVLQTRPEYAHEHLAWLPVVALSLSNLGFAAGLVPIPFILSCEMFSTGVRGSAQTVLMVVQGLANFGCTKTFIYIQDGVGDAGIFFVYAAVCAFATLFVMLSVKDVKPSVMH